jgi:hypothetical protein
VSRISHLLNITVNVERKTEPQDDYGYVSNSYSTNLSSIKARRHRLRETREILNDKHTYIITDEFHFDPGQDIKEGDRIVYDSQYFNIVFYDNPHDLSYFTIAQCSLLKDESNG